MARILVIDSEDKGLEEIRKAIIHLNPDIKIAGFLSFAALGEAVKKLSAEELVDFYKFDLMIFDYRSAKPAEWEARLAELKSANQITATICFTAFDDGSINRKHVSTLAIFNILYRPFDLLILKESINIALSSKKNVKPVEMRAQSATSTINILKEIEVISISELGFLTLNDSAISVQSTTKYFSSIFSHGKKQSAWAQCMMSIPLKSKPGFFISKFQFIGMDPACLLALRKFIVGNKKNHVANSAWSLAAPDDIQPVRIALIDTKDDRAGAFVTDLESHYQNVKVEFIKIDPSKRSEPSDEQYNLVINLNPSLKHDDFKNKFDKDMKYFLFSPDPLTDDKIKSFAAVYHDIFLAPLDKTYFYKKMKLHTKALALTELNEVMAISTGEKIKAASMVQLTEICELYVNFKYTRELSYGTMRDFVFMHEDENQITELPAFCNFSELIKAKPGEKTDAYFHQFIFLGMTDHYLKQIRIWLLQSFIEQNKRD